MAYQPNQSPTWAERDGLDPNDSRRIIKGADFGAEFDGIKSEFDRINRHGIVASVKYNGSVMTYDEGVSAVDPIGNTGYTVKFDSEIADFDEHYAVVITMFPSAKNRPTIPTVTKMTASEVEFTVTEFGLGSDGEPTAPVGFSMIIVDMASD